MRKLLVAVAVVAAFAAFGDTYYVDGSVETSGDGSKESPFKTVEAGIAAAVNADDVVEIAKGTYTLSTSVSPALTVSRAITVKGATGDPADVILKGAYRHVLQIKNAKAVVKDLMIRNGKVYNGKSDNGGGGVQITSAGGTLENCIVESCSNSGNSSMYAVAVMLNGGKVTGCIIRNSTFGTVNAISGIVYMTAGTLENSLVYGCSRGTNPDSVNDTCGVVYLGGGTVVGCTIAANTLSHAALVVANSTSCTVKDSIVWGNTAYRYTGAGRPNVSIGASAKVSNLCTTGAFGTNPIDADPCFRDLANKDFSLLPGSPCIGAGTDGRDLGYKPFDASTPALGVSSSVYKSAGPVEATVTLTAYGYDLTDATVTWDGLAETGTSFVHEFGPGTHTLTANVVLKDGTELSVTHKDAIKVTAVGNIYVDSKSTTAAIPYATPETAASTLADAMAIAGEDSTVLVSEGTYPISQTIRLHDNTKVIGLGDREKTTIDANSACRVFFLGHKDAMVANLKLIRGKGSRTAGGVWIGGNGGIVTNCVVHDCDSGQNVCNGGGVRLSSKNALVVGSCIKNCGASSYGHGAGVYLETGTICDSLVLSNSVPTRTSGKSYGGGIYMVSATADAKVINCTVAANKGSEGGGIYRVSDGGYVINTIVFNNTSTAGDANFVGNGGKTRSNAAAFLNCFSVTAIGTNPQTSDKAPYQLPNYGLDPSSGSMCINGGTNDYVTSSLDYLGQTRIFNDVVDIGAIEYCSTAIEPGVTADISEVAGATEITFTATVQGAGAKIEDFTAVWYLDGSSEPAHTGVVYSVTLGVGKHGVRLVLEKEGKSYEYVKEAGFVTVYPTDAYVGIGTSAEWPYDTPAKAATNLSVAVKDVLRKGVTLHIEEGRYPISSAVIVGEGMQIVGAGRDKTCVYERTSKNRVFEINGQGALVASLCASNAQDVQGGVYIYGDGGTFADGKIVKCKGTTNQAGGGAWLSCSNAKITRTVFEANMPSASSGDDSTATDHSGGGIYMESGIVENSLFVRNTARNAAAALVSDGTLRNCTVIGNSATHGTNNKREGCGGVVARGGSVINCLIVGNTDSQASADALVNNAVGASRFTNCCIPVNCGPGCVTNAPAFKDAVNGDYRIGAYSPCAYAGKWQSWMDGAVDFFGNPRTTPGKKVSIGFCQAPDPGLMLLVR